MQIDLLILSPEQSELAPISGASRSFVRICNVNDEPALLIHQAIRTLKNSNANRDKYEVTASKVFGLLYSASLRAQSLGRWATSGNYSPRADYRKLDLLVRKKLGPLCPSDHIVSQVRTSIAQSNADFSGLPE